MRKPQLDALLEKAVAEALGVRQPSNLIRFGVARAPRRQRLILPALLARRSAAMGPHEHA